MSKLLLVEDDEGLAELLALALRGLGHEVDHVGDGLTALTRLGAGHGVEAVVLDVMMPGIDGFETARRIRAVDQVPIIMLTARGDAIDIVAGLECGADDYVTKPVEPRVLDARIKALLRRVQAAPERTVHQVGELRIDEQAMTVTRAGAPLELSATEVKLLVEMARHLGKVLTRHQLLRSVWDYGYAGDSRLVDAAILRLRAKVEPVPSQPSYIHTVRGVGYRMDRP